MPSLGAQPGPGLDGGSHETSVAPRQAEKPHQGIGAGSLLWAVPCPL